MTCPFQLFISTSGTSRNMASRARLGKDLFFKKREFEKLFDYLKRPYNCSDVRLAIDYSRTVILGRISAAARECQ